MMVRVRHAVMYDVTPCRMQRVDIGALLEHSQTAKGPKMLAQA